MSSANQHSTSELQKLFSTRIAILDGAMGSMVQTYKLSEPDFRGTQFASHPHDLKGNNDILSITRPDVIEDIHRRYLEAGADILETNTFSATTIAQADYHLEGAVREMNLAAVKVAKAAVSKVEAAQPGRRCFIAGNLGPLNRTLSLSPDVNRPEYRAVSWSQVVKAYAEQTEALLEGGVDALLVETIFDTLNAKAAIFAIEEVFEKRGQRVPIMISVTITDASGRTLSGQTIGAFYNSIRHAKPFSVGINCALGGRQMRPYVEELANIAECYVTCHPNAGLPNAFGGYDETPADMAEILSSYAHEGFLNLAGGCCGSTPDHIRAIAQALRDCPPRKPAAAREGLHLSGLEALALN